MVLRAAGDPVRAAAEQRYLKSDLEFIGCRVPQVRRATQFVVGRQAELTRAELLAEVAALWGRPVFELRLAAIETLAAGERLLEAQDVAVLEGFLRESRTWALVDALTTGTLARLVERFPHLVADLDRWAGDDDFWIRRSAMLALLPAIRRGGGDFARFAGYADAMLEEREFFIRKAIGWMLREASKKRPDLVYEWLRPRLDRASGVTLREAVKYLRPEQRAALRRA
jgi:3-methyladenine DNA glycosylase AlkD